MNNTPTKQHFVPKIYLKRFTFRENGEIFKLKFKPYFPNLSTRNANISGVCYEKNIYTIETEDLLKRKNISDKYYIEKNRFSYENQFLEDSLDRLTNQGRISKSLALDILFMILDIKRRNPIMRDLTRDRSNLNNAFGKEMTKINVSIDKFREKYASIGIDLDQVRENIVKIFTENISNKEYVDDLYREGFLENFEKYQTEVAHHLLGLKFYIFKTKPQHEFFTNDNPGASLLNNEKVVNTAFRDFKFFSFPLDPYSLLGIINNDFEDAKWVNSKPIHLKEVGEEFVYLANKALVANCNSYILGNNKQTMESFLERFNKELNLNLE